jgi:mono/diheme cytochrome c family protein
VNKPLAIAIGASSALILALLAAGPDARADIDHGMNFVDGEGVYRFYCYQCHGYAGNVPTSTTA